MPTLPRCPWEAVDCLVAEGYFGVRLMRSGCTPPRGVDSKYMKLNKRFRIT